MIYARKIDDQWVELYGGFEADRDYEVEVEYENEDGRPMTRTETRRDTFQYPANWCEAATEEERTALGIFPVVDAPYPTGRYASIVPALDDTADRPLRIYTTMPYSAEEAAEMVWREIKQHRLVVLAIGAPTPSGLADCDDAARINVAGGVQMATIAKMNQQPFEVPWTMRDNSVVMLTADAMIAMGLAVGQHTSRVFGYSQYLRNAVADLVADGASSEAIFALDIKQGWPS
jgi:hypothetical protein